LDLDAHDLGDETDESGGVGGGEHHARRKSETHAVQIARDFS
jgi:hypothetical protein